MSVSEKMKKVEKLRNLVSLEETLDRHIKVITGDNVKLESFNVSSIEGTARIGEHSSAIKQELLKRIKYTVAGYLCDLKVETQKEFNKIATFREEEE